MNYGEVYAQIKARTVAALCVEQLWCWGGGVPRGTMQGRPLMASSPLCIVRDRRGE